MAFHRSLGLFDSTMLVAGSMIGSGVFIVSADIARTVGSPALLILVWGITGLLTLIAATSYGELAGMMPQAGGQYVYLRKSFGPLAGFLYGWTLFTVIQTGTIAAVAMAFAKFTAVLIPAMSEKAVLFDLGFLTISPAQLLAIAVIVLLTALNARGVELGKIIQNTFTSTKIISVVGLALVGLIIGLGRDDIGSVFSQASTIQFDTPLVLMTAIAVAMVGSVFSSDAWNNITFAAAEVKEPNRTIPKALVFGVVLVTALYILTNLSFVMLMPTMGDPAGAVAGAGPAADAMARGISFAVSDRVGSAAAAVMFGGAGAAIMAVLIMVSTFGCNNGLILSGSRAYYAMAEDGLFFKRAAVLNKNGVPATSLWIQCIWASALCLSGTYGALLDYVVIAALIFYSLTIFGIFRLRRTQPLAERPIKAFGYPFLPALYIIAATFICVVLLIEKPGTTWPGFIIIALGIPVYFAWTTSRR